MIKFVRQRYGKYTEEWMRNRYFFKIQHFFLNVRLLSLPLSPKLENDIR
jgi:hypothetical protein